MTVIVSEHRLWYVTDIIDRVLFMKNGRIEKDLSAREFNDLAEKPYSEFGLRTRTCIVPESSQECNMRCEMAGGTDGSTVLTAENLAFRLKFVQEKSLQLPVKTGREKRRWHECCADFKNLAVR